MKNKEKIRLKSITDIKVFLLFLLDNIKYPIDFTTLTRTISDNVADMTFDYEACLRELADAEHLLFDEIDGTRYYMISESGRLIAAELYDRLDPAFREASIRSAAKYISLSRTNASIASSVKENADKTFEVTVGAENAQGKLFSLTLNVSSRAEAEKIIANFEKNPDSIYRGILFCVTGRIEFMS